ncbi:YHYH protein [Alteromonas sp. KUL49]|uniref:YHYH protein n=1 Tax=Alteromonas sp. KUL49 TaxID=2480798 RepID=UPI00102F27D6|nr:YHYH protein [Alteromonas sp. KUL49]TAP37399.1 YHYH protein [Alteromonas sp. KUL49]GEA13039.1 hypothetical protein KUL49_34140 [Alteromonas sp. KUL49]
MRQHFSLSVLAVAISLTLSGCGGSDSSNEATTVTEQTPETTNSAPTIVVQDTVSVDAGTAVAITATITDADGDDLTVTWVQSSGIDVSFDGQGSSSISFTAPDEATTLVFQISVDDGVNDTVTASSSVTVNSVQTEPETPEPTPDSSVWLLNTNDTRAVHVPSSSSSLNALVNVQSVATSSIDGKSYTVVSSYGIPDYQVQITQDMYDELAQRPLANRDYISGSPTIAVGDTVAFGQDVGYNSNSSCGVDQGYGYWPPGPVCPSESLREGYFPDEPEPTDDDCSTGLGQVGLWVNGSSIYNWGDGQSYNNQGDWQTLAPVAEQYDVDICGGHAANGDYHHHFYSSCLAAMVNDEGIGHSPLYGFAADGYPVYGPWEDTGVLAISAWTVRDYSATSATGCSDGTRSCSLVDQYDPSQGVEVVSAGPDFTDTVTTLSGNSLIASNGYYYEDYYWDESLTEQGYPFLDQYNGHSDDERGYHYHITVAEVDGKLIPAFPYIIGDRFAGTIDDNALANCSTGVGGPPSR